MNQDVYKTGGLYPYSGTGREGPQGAGGMCIILSVFDYTMTRWTKMCIRQADCILIVGLAGKDPKVQEICVLFYLCVIIP